jgi:hypothetical protein
MSEISLRCQYFPEPLLAFANGELHIDPKAGIARYGPHVSAEKQVGQAPR